MNDDLHPGDPPNMDPPEPAPARRQAQQCQAPPPWQDQWDARTRLNGLLVAEAHLGDEDWTWVEATASAARQGVSLNAAAQHRIGELWDRHCKGD